MKWKSLLLMPAAGLLIYSAGIFNAPLAAMRQPPQSVALSYMRGSRPPPPAVVTVLFAGMRSLAADLLWIRASGLQEQGRYFELVQLADWITALEPRFKEVWAVQAWNMAYNISLMMNSDRDRWRWIESGISLLRDRGIPANAADPYLYSELAFIFYDKIGNPTDLSLQFLKRILAEKMMPLVGENGYADYQKIDADAAIKAGLLKEGLIPAKMREVDRIYGPLDWRVPQTHSLYWAWLGNNATGTNIHNAVCDRMICDSMNATFHYGKLTHSNSVFVVSPNLEILPKVIQTYEDTIANSDSDLPDTAYSNFLGSAVQTLKFFHHDRRAREIFDKLDRRYPSQATAAGYEKFTRHSRPFLPQIIQDCGVSPAPQP